ncbi:DUF6777 domain-containing protein [Streptomyces sp. NPDC001941]|uniref:DUF6777 domain-containing protein n=1 Tax=Streptomyces sp. NPDC001941 TaxID=3154659 RepID=UPI00332D743E
MRAPKRRPFSRPAIYARRTALTAVSAALLFVAACGGGGDGGRDSGAATDSKDVLLQPVAAQGPDPFTASTARATATPTPAPSTPAPSRPDGQTTPRAIAGSTPGLYGGTHSLATCDVEQQIRFLTGDRAKGRAFAEGAGISQSDIPRWLRSLSPVVLRVDTRVTNHGFRDGRATPFQSVLQAGTAVLVDDYGAPRVRCACGNPLRSPTIIKDPVHQGQPWPGYRPEKVVVINPTTTIINNLVIVNITDNTWLVCDTDSDDARCQKPAVDPVTDPDDEIPDVPDDPTKPNVDPSQLTDDPDASPSPGDSSVGPTPDTSSQSPSTSPTDCPSVLPSASPVPPGSPTPTPTLPPGCPTPTPTGPSPDGVRPLVPSQPDTPVPPTDPDPVVPPEPEPRTESPEQPQEPDPVVPTEEPVPPTEEMTPSEPDPYDPYDPFRPGDPQQRQDTFEG